MSFFQLGSEIMELNSRLARYKAALEEIREIYVGSDGFVPETAPEAYQERLLKQMYQEAVEALNER